jgi:hypothetical protein
VPEKKIGFPFHWRARSRWAFTKLMFIFIFSCSRACVGPNNDSKVSSFRLDIETNLITRNHKKKTTGRLVSLTAMPIFPCFDYKTVSRSIDDAEGDRSTGPGRRGDDRDPQNARISRATTTTATRLYVLNRRWKNIMEPAKWFLLTFFLCGLTRDQFKAPTEAKEKSFFYVIESRTKWILMLSRNRRIFRLKWKFFSETLELPFMFASFMNEKFILARLVSREINKLN